LGLYYEHLGLDELAWDRYAQALAVCPSWAGSGFWTAEPDRAAAWTEILDRTEKLAESAAPQRRAYVMAIVAWAQGNALLAEQEALLAIAAAPEWTDGYLWLARSLLDQGRVSEALEAAEQAVALEPLRSDVAAVLGCARYAAGDAARAESDLRYALFLPVVSPFVPVGSREHAYACLAELYRDRGDTNSAIWSYERAIDPRVVSQNVEVTLYGRLAGFDLLPTIVRIRLGEHEATPWLRLADLYEQDGRWEDARRVYLALLAEDPYLAAAHERLDALPLPRLVSMSSE
ncbi:MAG: tetratricopeptide repeat protein, partial [Anaerolineales bacterium]